MGVNGIYGLSGSGIDVESMVKVGMLSKQNQYDKMYKTETKDTWIKSAYSTFYSSMTTFKYTTLSNYKMQSVMNAMSASSSDTTSVTATANGAAASMAHKVSVSSLATNAYLMTTSGTKITRANTSSSTSTRLADVAFQSLTDAGTKDSSDTEQYNVTFADGTTGVVSGTDTALSYKISDGTTTKTLSYTYADLASSSDGKSLYDLATDIGKSGVNIQANYDATNDSFSLYNKSGGTANTISITALASSVGTGTTSESAAATLFSNMSLAAYDGSTLGDKITFTQDTAEGAAGTNGSVTIDGKTYSNLTDNKLTVSGVTYTFLNKTSSDATVTVSQDTDSIISSVKQFVSDYNTMLDSLNDKYYETQYSDYEPLTKSQESSMTQSQIEQWNEKAKSGLLYHSNVLRTITSSMREAIYTPVESVNSSYNSASAIGITSSTNKGHLTLDEDKLKTALAADPDCVYQIFASSQDSDSTSEFSKSSDYSNTGIANRLYDVMTTSLKTVSNYAGTSDDTDDSSYLGTLITNLKTKMSTFKTQMDAYEEILYNKYDAMETAIATLSSQLSSVTGSSS